MASRWTYDLPIFFSDRWTIFGGGKSLSNKDLGKHVVQVVELNEMAEEILRALELSPSVKLQKEKISSLFSQAKVIEEYHSTTVLACEGYCNGVLKCLREWWKQKSLLMKNCEDVLERTIQLRKEKHEIRLLSYERALAKYASSLNGADLKHVQCVALQVNDRVLRQWEELKNYRTTLKLFRFGKDKIAADENLFKERLEALNDRLHEDEGFAQISEFLAES
jgi:hypothetical protein